MRGRDSILALAAAGLLWLGLRRPRTAAPAPGGDVLRSLFDQSADSGGFPRWLIYATADVESGIRQLPPTGKGESRTFYPLGLTVMRARDWQTPSTTAAQIEAILGEVQGHVTLGAEELARLWRLYGPDHERVRVAWVLPAVAKRGRPWPERMGSVPTARRLARWHKAVRRHGGPPPTVA